jgi:hypothetical protein
MNLCLFLIAIVLGMTDRTVEYSAQVLYQNLETDHHRFLPKQNFVHYELLKVLLKIQCVLSSANTKNNICVGHHCTQTNTNNVWGFFFVQNFFSDNTRDRIFFFFCREFFFPEFNIRLYDKNSESGYFFSSNKIRIFFPQHWESEYFFRKKTHSPSLEVKWSLPYSYNP